MPRDCSQWKIIFIGEAILVMFDLLWLRLIPAGSTSSEERDRAK